MKRILSWGVAALFLLSEAAVVSRIRADDSGMAPNAGAPAEGSGGESAPPIDQPPMLGEDAGAAAPAGTKAKASRKKSSKKAKKNAKKKAKRAKARAKKASKKNAKRASRGKKVSKKHARKKELGLQAADAAAGQDPGKAAEFMPPPPAPEATPTE